MMRHEELHQLLLQPLVFSVQSYSQIAFGELQDIDRLENKPVLFGEGGRSFRLPGSRETSSLSLANSEDVDLVVSK